ncbi:MAG: S-ribosylhomocysteine lyase [Ruminococcus sp.]|nr:S-ribosylhomocysteine lyase [Oscillospiraceae bacterium]
MERITSFSVDHNTLEAGLYVSRIDGDITTYDLRFIKPNTPPFLEQKALHTIEHLFATFARNSEFAHNVIYFGPMGCRTGFYLLVRDLSNRDTITLIMKTLEQAIAFEGEIPGSKQEECGNYLEHDLEGAKAEMRKYYNVLKNWTIYNLQYK